MSTEAHSLAKTQLVRPYRPEHPVWRVFTRQEGQRILDTEGPEGFNRRMTKRNETIRRAEEDPYNATYRLVTWKLADVLLGFVSWADLCGDRWVPDRWKASERLRAFLEVAPGVVTTVLILGGNRAAKTHYMIDRAVRCIVDSEAEIWVFHQNERMSIDYHQKLAFACLPNEWKRLGKGKSSDDPTYISYSQQNGFSSNKVTAPNGSLMSFLNYEQDPEKTIEGGELGAKDKRLCVGYVADELIPLSWVETLEFRLATRGAKGLLGFTPVKGYTDTVATFLDGKADVYAEYWQIIQDEKRRLVPLVMRCADKSRAVLAFHTHYNPFGNYQEVLNRVAERTDEIKLMRLAGIPDKKAGARFVGYDEAVHVVPRERVAEWVEPGRVKAFAWPGTNWMVVDPARQKRWCVLWGRVDAYGRLWVYREWPQEGIYVPGEGFPEPWARAGSNKGHNYDGIPGKGCSPIGWGLHEYKAEFARLEGWADAGSDRAIGEWEASRGCVDRVHCRYMDSRFAHTPSQTSMGNTTLLEECGFLRWHFLPTFSQEGVGTVHEGAELIANALSVSQPGGPKLFVSEECTNLRFALKVWTGLDGQKGATKDLIDCLRYLLMARVGYIEDGGGHSVRRGAGYGAGMGGGGEGRDVSRKKSRIFGKGKRGAL